MKPQLHFYFDSKSLFNSLNNNANPELFKCLDKSDEYVCYVSVDSSEDLNSFLELLKNISGFSVEEIKELTNEIWDGYGFDALCEHFDEDTSNQILDESWEYLEGLFNS